MLLLLKKEKRGQVHFIDRLTLTCYNPSMPRTARIVLPNVPHHITSRGNRQQDVFFSKDDRSQYV